MMNRFRLVIGTGSNRIGYHIPSASRYFSGAQRSLEDTLKFNLSFTWGRIEHYSLDGVWEWTDSNGNLVPNHTDPPIIPPNSLAPYVPMTQKPY